MEIVWVGASDAATPAPRSTFAARLTPSCGGAVENALRPLVRSWPEANCTAPNVAETAITPKIAVRRSDMTLVPRPMAIRWLNVGRARAVLGRADHLTVSKFF